MTKREDDKKAKDEKKANEFAMAKEFLNSINYNFLDSMEGWHSHINARLQFKKLLADIQLYGLENPAIMHLLNDHDSLINRYQEKINITNIEAMSLEKSKSETYSSEAVKSININDVSNFNSLIVNSDMYENLIETTDFLQKDSSISSLINNTKDSELRFKYKNAIALLSKNNSNNFSYSDVPQELLTHSIDSIMEDQCDYNDSFDLHLKLDMSFSDDDLITQLSKLIKEKKKTLGHEFDSISSKTLHRWKNQRILAIWDLQQWCQLNNINIKRGKEQLLIFPNPADGISNFSKTPRESAFKVICKNTLNLLKNLIDKKTELEKIAN